VSVKLSVIGTGYVGLVTGACLADVGNDVLCLDVDADKIRRLRAGDIPIHEPGLDQVVARGVAAGRLRFTTDYAEAVEHAEQRHRRHLTESAERQLDDVLARILDDFQVLRATETVANAIENFHESGGAEPTGRALPAGLVTAESDEIPSEVNRAHGIIENNEAARAEHSS
jgi:hypothetical protein